PLRLCLATILPLAATVFGFCFRTATPSMVPPSLLHFFLSPTRSFPSGVLNTYLSSSGDPPGEAGHGVPPPSVHFCLSMSAFDFTPLKLQLTRSFDAIVVLPLQQTIKFGPHQR